MAITHFARMLTVHGGFLYKIVDKHTLGERGPALHEGHQAKFHLGRRRHMLPRTVDVHVRRQRTQGDRAQTQIPRGEYERLLIYG